MKIARFVLFIGILNHLPKPLVQASESVAGWALAAGPLLGLRSYSIRLICGILCMIYLLII